MEMLYLKCMTQERARIEIIDKLIISVWYKEQGRQKYLQALCVIESGRTASRRFPREEKQFLSEPYRMRHLF